MDYFDILLAKKLNGGGGGDITIEDLAITANGEYRAPSGKAFGKVTANVPAPSNAIFKQTLTGLPSPIATFTGTDAPIDSLKASIVGVQDLHGYDSPWVGGAGKNLLKLSISDIKHKNTVGTWSGNVYTLYGITYTVQTDSDENVVGIKVNGTATNSDSHLIIDINNLTNGTAYIATLVVVQAHIILIYRMVAQMPHHLISLTIAKQCHILGFWLK